MHFAKIVDVWLYMYSLLLFVVQDLCITIAAWRLMINLQNAALKLKVYELQKFLCQQYDAVVFTPHTVATWSDSD